MAPDRAQHIYPLVLYVPGCPNLAFRLFLKGPFSSLFSLFKRVDVWTESFGIWGIFISYLFSSRVPPPGGVGAVGEVYSAAISRSFCFCCLADLSCAIFARVLLCLAMLSLTRFIPPRQAGFVHYVTCGPLGRPLTTLYVLLWLGPLLFFLAFFRIV